MSHKFDDVWRGFLEQLKADRKRAAILVVAVLVLVVVAIRQFGASGPPDAAVAVTLPSSTTAAPTDELTRPRDEAPPDSHRHAPAADSQTKARQDGFAIDDSSPSAGGGRTVNVDRFPRRLERDLFQTESWSRFPLASSLIEAVGGSGETASRTNLWSQMGEIVSDYQSSRAARIEEIEADLSALALQSTMTGSAPMAHISGRLVRVGDSISGFLVKRIEDRRVMLRRDGVERVLTLR
jgi:hypothetical protein